MRFLRNTRKTDSLPAASLRVSLAYLVPPAAAFALLSAMTMLASAADTRYYLVEGVMKLADGRNVGSNISLIKRTVDRDAGRIEEVVLTLRGQDPAREFTTVITPKGGKASVSSTEGGIAGEATLTGPEWAWTGMKFSTKIEPSGSRIEGEDEFSPDGLKAHKDIFKPDGNIQIRIDESGHAINKPVYEMLRSRLLAK